MSWAYQPLPAAAAQLGAGGGAPTYTLAADAGGFTLGGEAAATVVSRRVSCGAGSFAAAGQTVQFGAPGGVLSADGAAFAVSGGDAAFPRARRLSAGHGAFALTGLAVETSGAGGKLRALNLGLPLGL
jgi:hypothetical protein